MNASEAGDHELYNLNEDPLEVHNLASDPAEKERMEDLLGRIEKWQEETGDTVNIQHEYDPIA